MKPADITHYWSIVHLSNPPGLYFKMADGSFAYGYAERGELPKSLREAPEPSVIHGINPETLGPMDFGEWVPMHQWLSQRENFTRSSNLLFYKFVLWGRLHVFDLTWLLRAWQWVTWRCGMPTK